MDTVDGALATVAVGAVNVVHGDAVVELLLLLVGKVSQAIPLARHLRVKGPYVVVHGPRSLGEELLVEELAGEEGPLGLCVQRPV